MELSAETVSEIYGQKQLQTPEEARISFQSETISVCESSELCSPRASRISLQPGEYSASIYYRPDEELKELEDSPTLGIDAVVVSFSDNEIARWEEVVDDDEEPLVDSGNLIDFVLGDQSTISDHEDEITETLEECHTEGFEVCEESGALVVYVGEVALEHKFFWALDADSNPTKLAGFFVYPS